MDKIKKGLGRGLSSLIGETKIEPKKNLISVSWKNRNTYHIFIKGCLMGPL